MPIVLNPLTGRVFDLFRDPQQDSPVSSLSWESPLELSRLTRPKHRRTNLFPNGNFETQIPLDDLELSADLDIDLVDDWATVGRYSAKVTTTDDTTPSISSSDSLVMSARAGVYCSAGVTVKNGAPESRTFSFTFTLGDETYSEQADLAADAVETLSVLSKRAPYNVVTETTDDGTSSFTRLSFILESPDEFASGESFSLDSIFVGEGRSADFVPNRPYPGSELRRGDPVRLWAQNVSTDTLTNIRVGVIPSGPGHPYQWVEVSRDPDIVPWADTRLSPVVVDTASIAPGVSTSFWIRPVIDEHMYSGDHSFAVTVGGD